MIARHIICLLAGFGLLSSVSAGKAFAEDAPINVSLALASPALSAGEPISVTCKIVNKSEFPAYLSAPRHPRGYWLPNEAPQDYWIEFSLVDANGSNVRGTLTSRPLPPIRLLGGLRTLGAGQSLERIIAAGPAVTPPSAGEYTLVARVRLSYQLQTAQLVDRVKYDLVSRDLSLPLRVAGFRRKRLEEVCDRLSRQLLGLEPFTQGTDHEWCEIGLFSVRESVGLPYWSSVLEDPRLPKYVEMELIEQITRLNSFATVLLLSQVWSSSERPDCAALARRRLLEVHRDGNPNLRRPIERLFVDREGKFLPLAKMPTGISIDGG